MRVERRRLASSRGGWEGGELMMGGERDGVGGGSGVEPVAGGSKTVG